MNAELRELQRVNQQLEVSGPLDRGELRERGLILEATGYVYRVGAGEGPKQRLPFKRLLLPLAYTGILVPNKTVSEQHKAIQILLPGTGTTFSVAETLCDVAGTFHGRKSKNRGRGRKASQSTLAQVLPQGEVFNVASFPADLPLNGMGWEAPFEFASEHGLMLVVRHLHLVLSHLYPGRPVFVVGRSQGGLAAILYAQHHADVAGAIAINPPHPDPELFQYTVDYLEERAGRLSELLFTPGISLHRPSWEAYKAFTPSCDYPARRTLAATQVLVGMGDTFNYFPKYADMLKAFGKGSPLRQVFTFDVGHNLWDRKATEMYRRVISTQTNLMLRQVKLIVPEPPRRDLAASFAG